MAHYLENVLAQNAPCEKVAEARQQPHKAVKPVEEVKQAARPCSVLDEVQQELQKARGAMKAASPTDAPPDVQKQSGSGPPVKLAPRNSLAQMQEELARAGPAVRAAKGE